MSRQSLTAAVSVFSVSVLVATSAIAQTAPRTSWGQPDLGGIWDFRTITPLQRPVDRADQEFLTEEEAAELEQATIEKNIRLLNRPAERTVAADQVDSRSDGTPGFYNNFWLDDGTTTTGRTSLIIDPPNGRTPPMTPAALRLSAARRAYGRAHPADSWLAVAALAVTGVIGQLIGSALLVSASIVLVGFVAIAWASLASPGIVALGFARSRIGSLDRLVVGLLTLLLYVVTLGTLVYGFYPWISTRALSLLLLFSTGLIILQLTSGTDRDLVKVCARWAKHGLFLVVFVLIPSYMLWSYVEPALPENFVQSSGQRLIRTATGTVAQPVLVDSVDALQETEFFDRVTGAALIWYVIRPGGGYALFDSDGFHPASGQALAPITREVVRDLQQRLEEEATLLERERLASVVPPLPERLMYESIEDVEFFDRRTGEPSIWYTETPDGSFELGLPRFRGRVRTWVSSALLQLSPLVVDG